MSFKRLSDFALKGKRVFIRADLNVPVQDGKVTSEPEKGYYYFWVVEQGKKRYVQTPIARTYIEEIE